MASSFAILFRAHYLSRAGRIAAAIEIYSAMCPPLSKELSNRVPTEVWQAIAAQTIKPYRALLIDDTVRHKSIRPRNEVNLDKNHIQDMLNICLVSKALRAGIRAGIREHFSDQLYFWSGNLSPELCTLIETNMASHVTQLNIHISSTEASSLSAFRSEWSQFIHSKGFTNLREVQVTAPCSVNHDTFDEWSEEDEGRQIEEETAKIEGTVAEAGLDARIPCAFRIYAYIHNPLLSSDLAISTLNLQPPGFDTETANLLDSTGRAITDSWERKCKIPISCRQLSWLWSVEPKPKPATT